MKERKENSLIFRRLTHQWTKYRMTLPKKKKYPRKIPKIFGIFSSENYTDSSDKTNETVIDENPETDISDKIDPSIFENVLQKQNEAIAQGLSSDDIDANLTNKAGSDDEFDAIADIIEKEDEFEKLNGVTESAEKLASFAEKNQSESEQNNPISDELLTRFLSNSDENPEKEPQNSIVHIQKTL